MYFIINKIKCLSKYIHNKVGGYFDIKKISINVHKYLEYCFYKQEIHHKYIHHLFQKAWFCMNFS